MTQTVLDQVDYGAIKRQQQAMWASGDYSVIGTPLLITSELLCEAAQVRACQRVLDVAAGNGNTALAAARRNAEVVAIDYVPELLERGRLRAAAEGLAVDFRESDLEQLPFADGSFDVVLSTFGVMFSPGQEQAAGELCRVCRPGGRIGLANWTPEGFIGQLLRLVGSYAPPPAGVRPPTLWGTEARLHELFVGAADIAVSRRMYTFTFRSPEALTPPAAPIGQSLRPLAGSTHQTRKRSRPSCSPLPGASTATRQVLSPHRRSTWRP
jgi:SAM-dependent methyltransferase